MFRFLALLLLMPAAALAEPPRVVADIAPVHSLVARVMQGVGTPALLLPPGASPHGYAMRPSEAVALTEADVVFWVGPELTPWLERAIGSLGGHAVILLDAPGTVQRAAREGHGDDHGDGHGDDHGNDHGDDHGHDGAHGHGGHDGARDPHAWLDPLNAGAWLAAIAAELAAADPTNAAAYRANADAGAAELAALSARVETVLAPHRGGVFVVYHDAYRHFEDRFGLHAAGSVSESDAARPGARRFADLQDLLADNPGACLFGEPQAAPATLGALAEGTGARIGTLDPLGTGQTPGPDLYSRLIEGMAASIAGCLGG